MAYATAQNVQALIPELTLSATSKPTLSEVGAIIDQASGEIDGVLRAQGYRTIPATGATDLLLLAGHVSRFAAAQAYLAGYGGNDAPYKVKAWLEGWESFIARLRRGEQRLNDQDPASTQAGYLQSGVMTIEEWGKGDEWA